jgi:transposase
MGTAIAVRTDYSSEEARRLLAMAAVLDGASRQEAAKIGGMGPDGLINKLAPGAPGKLSKPHKAFLARLVEDGPIPAIDGMVRWRA